MLGTPGEPDEVDEEDRDDLALLIGRPGDRLERRRAGQAEAGALRVLFAASGAQDHERSLGTPVVVIEAGTLERAGPLRSRPDDGIFIA